MNQVVEEVSTLNERVNTACDFLIPKLEYIIKYTDVEHAASKCHDLHTLLLSDTPKSPNLHNALNDFKPRIKNILKLLNDVPVNLPHSMQTDLVNKAKDQMGGVLLQMTTLLFLINLVPNHIKKMREEMPKSHADKEYCETLDSLETIKKPVTRLINMMDKCKAILNRLNAIISDSLKLADSGHSPSNTIFTGLRRKTSKDHHHSARSRSVNIVSDDDSPKSSHLAKSTSTHSSGRSKNKQIHIVSPDSQQSARSSSRQSTKKTHHANTVSPDENSKQSVKSPSAKTLKKWSQLKPKPPSTKLTDAVNYKKHPGRTHRVSTENYSNPRRAQSH